MSEEKDLRVIDVDFIRQLRAEGRWEEAKDLLKAFRKDVKQAGLNKRNEILRKDRIIKKTKGVCSQDCCMEPIFNWGKCEYHYYLHKDWKDKTKEEKKSLKLDVKSETYE